MKKGNTLLSIGFLAPCTILYLVFIIYAIISAFYYTMVDWPGIASAPKVWAWFQNYKDLLSDADYWKVTSNTFIFVALCIVIQNTVGLLLAFFVSQSKFGYKFFRSAIFLPVVVPMVRCALMFTILLGGDFVDILNKILRVIGLGGLQTSWLTNKHTVLYCVALPQLWQFLGIQFALFLAGIQSIPSEILESAVIDGANRRQQIVHIIIPMIWDIIQISIILNVTGALKGFDYPWIMTWGGPGISSAYISTYMYTLAFKGFQFSYGTTVAMTIFLYSLVFTVLFKRFTSRKESIY